MPVSLSWLFAVQYYYHSFFCMYFAVPSISCVFYLCISGSKNTEVLSTRRKKIPFCLFNWYVIKYNDIYIGIYRYIFIVVSDQWDWAFGIELCNSTSITMSIYWKRWCTHNNIFEASWRLTLVCNTYVFFYLIRYMKAHYFFLFTSGKRNLPFSV